MGAEKVRGAEGADLQLAAFLLFFIAGLLPDSYSLLHVNQSLWIKPHFAVTRKKFVKKRKREGKKKRKEEYDIGLTPRRDLADTCIIQRLVVRQLTKLGYLHTKQLRKSLLIPGKDFIIGIPFKLRLTSATIESARYTGKNKKVAVYEIDSWGIVAAIYIHGAHRTT